AHLLREVCRPEQLLTVRSRLGDALMIRDLEPDLRHRLSQLMLPLPSARLKLEPGDPGSRFVQAALAEEGLELRQLRVQGIRELFFSRGERAALCLPGNLRYEHAEDELHPGQRKLLVQFDLPRGSYATLLVKRISC